MTWLLAAPTCLSLSLIFVALYEPVERKGREEEKVVRV